MQKEVYFVEKLLENKQRELMRSTSAWKDYLETAGRNFKYDHVDTMLIEAQQRESSTLASAEFWTGKPFHRKLKENAIGVAVLRNEGKRTSFDYLYDVSQTEGEEDERLKPWTYQEKYFEEILNLRPYPLYHMENKDDTLEEIISQNTFNEAMKAYQERFPEKDGLLFASLVASSATYCICKRCNIEMQLDHEVLFNLVENINDEEFWLMQSVIDKSRKEVLNVVSNIARREEKENQRRNENERREGQRNQNRVRETARRNTPPITGVSQQSERRAGLLWDDGQGVPERESERQVSENESERNTATVLPTDRRDSRREGTESVRHHAESQATTHQRTEQSARENSPTESNQNRRERRGHQELRLPESLIQDKTEEIKEAKAEAVASFLLPERKVGEEVYFNERDYIITSIHKNEIGLQEKDFPLLVSTMSRKYFEESMQREASMKEQQESEEGQEKAENEAKSTKKLSQGKVTKALGEVVSQGTGDWVVDAIVISLYLTGRGTFLARKTLENIKENMWNVVDKEKVNVDGVQFEEGLASWEQVANAVLELDEKKQLALPEGILLSTSELEEEKVQEEGLEEEGLKEATEELEEAIPLAKETNFRYDENHLLDQGGIKTKYKRNIEAIELLKEIENREKTVPVSQEEQKVLSLYVGWGGMPQVFDPNNESWIKEYTQLRNVLDEAEYESAFQSVYSAFYTPPEMIDSVYQTLEKMNFSSGRILDPCMGTGHFFGQLPQSLQSCELTGIELDDVSGRISKQLYPNADIHVKGYQDTVLRDDYFDVAIGNVPFGQVKVYDPRYNHLNLNVHDYFFAKTMDKVHAGGVVAFITSTGTMDKSDGSFRKYLAERADLLGAVRLPSKSFASVAHTDIDADILFLQKRAYARETMPEWVDIAETDDGIPVNQYFAENPNMMLGELVHDTKFFGNANSTLLQAREGENLNDALQEAMTHIKGEIKTAEQSTQHFILDEEGNPPEKWFAQNNIRNNTFTLVQGDNNQDYIYYREGAELERVDTRSEKRLRAMMQLRDCAKETLQAQLPQARMGVEIFDEGRFTHTQKQLNEQYDQFVKKYGSLNKTSNKNLFRDDIDATFMLALENVDTKGKTSKADIFSKRTIFPEKAITEVDTAQEALAVSLSQKGYVDLLYMQTLYNADETKLIEELKGQIFLNPNDLVPMKEKWLREDEYLSGNVREKLEEAQKRAEQDEHFAVNVEALQKIQPETIPVEDISIALGANWIPSDVMDEFSHDLFPHSNLNINYSLVTGQWTVDGSKPWSVASHESYGMDRINGYKLFDMVLNQKSARLYDEVEITDDNGEKRTVRKINGKDTAIANQMQAKIKERFSDWLKENPEIQARLGEIYNVKFNSERLRTFNGSFLTFPQMNATYRLREHQKDAVARTLYGGNTLLAHEVGTGKSFTMIASAMKKKQLGIANKQVLCVPKHLVEQMGKDFLTLYPQANILVASERDFGSNNRKRFLNKIALNDFDAIIMSHEQFGKIPLSAERQLQTLQEQREELKESLSMVDKGSFNAKRMAKMLDNMSVKIQKIQDKINDNSDEIISMEEMGIDGLFVDEAQAYKNLAYTSNLENVSGLSAVASMRATDMKMKVDYINEVSGNHNVVFATGTPVSNTIAEAYTMQRYLQSDYLKEKGLQHFDAWVSNFAEATMQMELKPAGDGYRPRTRFRYFHNLPELLHQFHRIADVKFASDMPDIVRPTLQDGKIQTVVVEPTPAQDAFIKSLGERADKLSSGAVDPKDDNMLLICSDGRKTALDMRLIDPTFPDEEGSKINVLAQNVANIADETKEQRSTQLIFCDIGTPNSNERYSVYDSIKEKLIQQGIPENEIAFIHDAGKNEEKEALFEKMRTGEARILLGSTQKCGAGTNIQDKMIALHHADCPWKPSDVEQRNGRAHRQGNENKEIRIFNYVTRNSFDSYNWQLIEQKQSIISQIMHGNMSQRSVEDVDDVVQQYAEIKAIASGNPLIREKVTLENEVDALYQLKSGYQQKQNKLEQLVESLPKKQVHLEQRQIHLQNDIRRFEPLKNNDFSIVLQGKPIKEREEAGKVLLKLVADTPLKQNEKEIIGEYSGFNLRVEQGVLGAKKLFLQGAGDYAVELGASGSGNITRLQNVLNSLDTQLVTIKSDIEKTKNDYQEALSEQTKPFAQETELIEKVALLDQVNTELGVKEWSFEIGEEESDETQAHDYEPIEQDEDFVLE